MRLYLDTSVISAYYDERTPERMQATREFWNALSAHEPLYSDLTEKELGQATPELAEKLRSLTSEFRMISINEPMRQLASVYVDRGVVPARYSDDSVHIAAAVIGDADVLVSWNFKHLVRRNTRLLVNNINAERGLKNIEILAPPEL